MTTDTFSFQQELCEGLSRIIHSARAYESGRAVLLPTRDRDFAMQIVREIATRENVSLYHYSMASRRQYQPERRAFTPAGGALHDPHELLYAASQLRGSAVVILEDFLRFVSDAQGDPRARAELSQMLSHEHRCGGHVYIFMASPEAEALVPSPLRNLFQRLEVPLPRADELEFIAREEIAAALARQRHAVDASVIRQWAKAIAPELPGLTQCSARYALRDALGPVTDLPGARVRLAQRKAQQLSQELSMDMLDTKNVEPPIGLDNVYRYVEVHRARIGVPGRNRCKGILLVGPPGTGKTMLARYIGGHLGLNTVEFRISSLMNSYVGETEQRFARAFAVCDAMSPVVIFVDELEKIFGEQGGERDGGTMMRATAGVLSWMSDSEAPNFIVATANSVTRMGEIGKTMTRKGRIDRLFFVDVPGQRARAKILERLLEDRAGFDSAELARLAASTERFSGVDLRAIVEDGTAQALHSGRPLSPSDLEREIERNRLRVDCLYEEFNPLRRWAQLNCEPAGPTD
jgi:hypothetical protein